MTLKQLKYFITIAETENLTKAAELLNISQPPLSYQLKLLEDELGIRLFERKARNLSITEEGEFFRERVEKICIDLENTVQQLENFSEGKKQSINVGVVSSANHNMLPELVNEFLDMNDGAVINVYTGNNEQVIELITQKKIDIGILRGQFDREDYYYKRVKLPMAEECEDDYFVAVGREELFSSTDREDVKMLELVNSNLIVHRYFEDGFIEECKKQGFFPNIISSNDNTLTSIEWVEHGLGIAIMPLSSSFLLERSEIDEIVVKRIVAPITYANLYAIWSKDIELSKMQKDFIELI